MRESVGVVSVIPINAIAVEWIRTVMKMYVWKRIVPIMGDKKNKITQTLENRE